MNLRDKIFLTLGFGLTLVGILATVLYGTNAGVIILILFLKLILILQLLQRKQLARLQERTLTTISAINKHKQTAQKLASTDSNGHKNDVISNKKLIGLLQAQQVSMEILNDKIGQLTKQSKI